MNLKSRVESGEKLIPADLIAVSEAGTGGIVTNIGYHSIPEGVLLVAQELREVADLVVDEEIEVNVETGRLSGLLHSSEP